MPCRTGTFVHQQATEPESHEKSRLAPTATVAVVAVGSNIAVNYATDGKHGWWTWLAGVGLTVGGFAASLWLFRRQQGSLPGEQPVHGVELTNVEARGLRAHSVRSSG